MGRALLQLAVVPAILLGLVTAWRVSMELSDPSNPIMPWVSANGLSVVWMFVLPALLLRRGLSLGGGLLVAFVFFLLFRLPIGVVYGLAWDGQWTVESTGELTRYVTDTQEMGGDVSAGMLTVMATFLPLAFGMVFTVVLWSVYWVVAFRGRRPFAGGVAA